MVHASSSQPLGSGESLKLLLANKQTLSIAAFASLGGLCFGYDQVISNVLVNEDFITRFGLSPWEEGLLTSILELFALVGSLLSSYLLVPLSPHRTLIVFALIFLVGSSMQTAANSTAILTVGRAIGGVGIGGMSTITPLYCADVSATEVRGSILCLEQMSIVLGVVLGFWVGWATRSVSGSVSWRLPLLLQMLPAVILLAALCTIFPTSPRWLAAQKDEAKQAEGRRVLAKLRQKGVDSQEVVEEWNEILLEARFAVSVEAERRGTSVGLMADVKADLRGWGQLFSRGVRKRTMVGVGVTTMQQMSGINALLYYGPELLAHLGLTGDSAVLLGSGMINIIQLLATIPPLLLIDSLGRRPLLITGATGMTLSYIFISLVVYQYGGDWAHHQVAAWSSVGGIYAFTAFYGVSFGPIGWILPSEVFPASCRGKGVSLSTSSTWFFNFLVGLLTPVLNDISTLALYLFFTFWCALALLFALFIVPETRGVSLEDMAAVFGDTTALADEERKARIEREIAQGSQSHAGDERRGLLENEHE